MKLPVWGVVPAKSPSRGKSRLSGALSDLDRAAFARELLTHVLDVLVAAELDGVLVATDSDEVADLAAARGAAVLRDMGTSGLAKVIQASGRALQLSSAKRRPITSSSR